MSSSKPEDAPEFWDSPPPAGRSRESAIRLDREGKFFDHNEPVTHPKLRDAMHTWITRHPVNGRYVLSNSYDWSYFEVEDSAYFVSHLREHDGDIILVLSDSAEEPLEPGCMRANARGELYALVKRRAKGGPYEAKFTRFAQSQLGPFLQSDGGGNVTLATKRGVFVLPAATGDLAGGSF